MSATAAQAPPGDVFSQLDANHDGVLTREEFYGAATAAARAGAMLTAPSVSIVGGPMTYAAPPTYFQGGQFTYAAPATTYAMPTTTYAVPQTMGVPQEPGVGQQPPVMMEPIATLPGQPIPTYGQYTVMQPPTTTVVSQLPPTTAAPVYVSVPQAEHGYTMAQPITTAVTTAEPRYIQGEVPDQYVPSMPPVITTAAPVYAQAPEAPQHEPLPTEPVPVATNTYEPVPVQTVRDVVMGGVTQQRIGATVMRDEARKTYTQHAPTTVHTREVGQAVYMQGPTFEEERPAQIVEIRQEQAVMGQTQERVVEIPTLQVIEEIQEIPEIQIRQMIQEVPQIIQEPVEQLMEQIVEVPLIIQQRRVQQQLVEQVVEVPIPMTQEEIVHVPTIIQQARTHHVSVEQIVDIHVPHEREEIVHVPKIIQQERIQQQLVEQIVEVPVPMVQEELVHVPKIIQQERIQQQLVEQIVEVPIPMTQEEIVHIPKIIQQTRTNHVSVEQIVDIHVPHQREEIVHVPKIIQQERIQQQLVEQIVEVPVPMVQEEIIQVPKIIQQERIQQQLVEMVVEVPIPMTQEELVHVPKIIQQERTHQQMVEQVVEVPVPMSQEEIVHVPTIVQQARGVHIEVEQIVEVPVPMTQEEIVHVPKIIQQERNHHFHVEEFVDVVIEQRVEEIVHVPVIQTQERIVQNPVEIEVEVPRPQVIEKTIEVPKIMIEERIIRVPKVHQTVLDTVVHNQVRTIEVVKPKIVKKVVQRKKIVVQDEIRQVPKIMKQQVFVQKVIEREVQVPQVQIVDEIVEVPVQKQIQMPSGPLPLQSWVVDPPGGGSGFLAGAQGAAVHSGGRSARRGSCRSDPGQAPSNWMRGTSSFADSTRSAITAPDDGRGCGYVNMADALDLPSEAFEIPADDLQKQLLEQKGSRFAFTRHAKKSIMMRLGANFGDYRTWSPTFTTTEDVYTKCSDEHTQTTYMAMVIGIGIFDLSKAMAKCGYVVGVLFLLALVCLHLFLCHRLLEIPRLVQQNLETYGDIAKVCFSRWNYRIAVWLVMSNWFSTCSLHLISVLRTIDTLECGKTACVGPGWKLLVGLLLAPIVFRTNAKDLRMAAVISLYSMLACIAVEAVCAVIHGSVLWKENRHKAVGDPRHMLGGVEDMIISFNGLASLPYIISEMLVPQHAKKVVNKATLHKTLVYVLVALIGYFGWGDKLQEQNVDPIGQIYELGHGHLGYRIASFTIQIFFMLKTVATFPLFLWPLLREMEAYLGLEDRLSVEMRLPWALDQAWYVKQGARGLCLFLTICPTLIPDSYAARFQEVVPSLTCLVQFCVPSLFALMALKRHQDMLRIYGAGQVAAAHAQKEGVQLVELGCVRPQPSSGVAESVPPPVRATPSFTFSRSAAKSSCTDYSGYDQSDLGASFFVSHSCTTASTACLAKPTMRVGVADGLDQAVPLEASKYFARSFGIHLAAVATLALLTSVWAFFNSSVWVMKVFTDKRLYLD